MKIPKAWIFDLDGIIVETTHFHFKAWQRLADSLDIHFDESHNEAIKGVSRSRALKKILSLDNRSVSDRRFRELMDQKNSWYRDYLGKLTPDNILEGIPAFLVEIRDMGGKLVIGSSSKNARYVINYLQLTDTFDAIVDGTNVDQGKPAPQIFLQGAEAVDAEPDECIVFEDAAAGVEAAKAAGMLCIGVGSEEILGDADLVISTFKDWTPSELLEELNVDN